MCCAPIAEDKTFAQGPNRNRPVTSPHYNGAEIAWDGGSFSGRADRSPLWRLAQAVQMPSAACLFAAGFHPFCRERSILRTRQTMSPPTAAGWPNRAISPRAVSSPRILLPLRLECFKKSGHPKVDHDHHRSHRPPASRHRRPSDEARPQGSDPCRRPVRLSRRNHGDRRPGSYSDRRFRGGAGRRQGKACPFWPASWAASGNCPTLVDSPRRRAFSPRANISSMSAT